MSSEPLAEVIELTFPASSKFIRLSRLAAASLATELDFDVEAVDDLRIAVDEAVTVLITGDHHAAVTLRFEIVADGLVIEGQCRGDNVEAAEVSDIVEAILSATTDTHRVEAARGVRQFRFEKHHSDADALAAQWADEHDRLGLE